MKRASFAGQILLGIIGLAMILGSAAATPCAAADMPLTTKVISLNGAWSLAVDPKNVGREEKWGEKALADAKDTKVPGVLQDTFPGYHGVVWYARDFTPPKNARVQGRYLLRFWQVDYLADVWLNGVSVGHHEGGEDPFVLDVTDVIKPETENRLVVRVLNPTDEGIDGFKLSQIPRRNKTSRPTPGADYNHGGITDAVDLLLAPAARVEDLFVRADWKTGKIRIQANVRNAGKTALKGHVAFSVSPATSGETLDGLLLDRELPPGDTRVEGELQVENWRLWELNDPCLYRVSACVMMDGSNALDEQSTRCGFRDFRFENGAFRLNGKRIFLKCSHSGCELPALRVAVDRDMLRKDIENCKVMGFNAIRFIAGIPPRYQLDLCDEIGLMVYDECYAGWCLGDSPKMAERFDHATTAMILRDRNHPSITMWGLLNETNDGPVFRHALDTLPMVRELDDSRLVFLNSGRWDLAGAAVLNGLASWASDIGPDPNVTLNTRESPLQAPWATWGPKQLAMHPGPNKVYSAVRWTAPSAGKYDVAATFDGIGVGSTADVHVFLDGKAVTDSAVTGPGKKATCGESVSLAAGATVMFVVGEGTGGYGGDTIALTASIKSEGGQTFDPAKDYSTKENPNGPWSFGYLKAGDKPDVASFSLYKNGKVEGAKSSREIGSLSNPGSAVWEDVMADAHPYQSLPYGARVIHTLRNIGANGNPLFVSEGGMGSAVDLARMARHFEQWGKTYTDDAAYYRDKLDKFTADWDRWNLGDTFANPEDYFRQCLAWMADLRKLEVNALRSNPNIIGYSLTGTQDQGLSGEGLTTLFRELKPGTIDAVFDAWYPLRWCLFVEPVQVYRGQKARIEAILANEDALNPGDYPVRLQVVGPNNESVFDRKMTITIPDPKGKPEPRFTLPVLNEEVVIGGPSGKYRFLAIFEKGAAAAGGCIEFYVADRAEMPKVETEVTLWGDDPELAKWLDTNGIKTRAFTPGVQTARELILVGRKPAAGEAEAFRELAKHIARGSQVVFLCPEVFQKDNDLTRWLPLAKKGGRNNLNLWLYHKDDWLKRHPIFDGLPAGCIMEHNFYRELIPSVGFNGQEVPDEVVAGAIDAACGYGSALTVGVYKLAAGRFTFNTLRIRDNLGNDPVAERLLRNMLRHAARDLGTQPADLPADFDSQLKSLGY